MLTQDIRYGIRMLRRNPGFAIVASITLALGIGATTAIFSIVNAVLWRDLPYRDAGRLVQLWETNPERNWTEAECAPANVADWRSENRSFVDMAAYFGNGRDAWVSNYALTGAGEPERLKGISVTANFFSVWASSRHSAVRSPPKRNGRARRRRDDERRLMAAAFWRRPVDHRRTVSSTDPRTSSVCCRRASGSTTPPWMSGCRWDGHRRRASTRRPHYLRVVARLKPGVSVEQSQIDVQRIALDLRNDIQRPINRWAWSRPAAGVDGRTVTHSPADVSRSGCVRAAGGRQRREPHARAWSGAAHASSPCARHSGRIHAAHASDAHGKRCWRPSEASSAC